VRAAAEKRARGDELGEKEFQDGLKVEMRLMKDKDRCEKKYKAKLATFSANKMKFQVSVHECKYTGDKFINKLKAYLRNEIFYNNRDLAGAVQAEARTRMINRAQKYTLDARNAMARATAAGEAVIVARKVVHERARRLKVARATENSDEKEYKAKKKSFVQQMLKPDSQSRLAETRDVTSKPTNIINGGTGPVQGGAWQSVLARLSKVAAIAASEDKASDDGFKAHLSYRRTIPAVPKHAKGFQHALAALEDKPTNAKRPIVAKQNVDHVLHHLDAHLDKLDAANLRMRKHIATKQYATGSAKNAAGKRSTLQQSGHKTVALPGNQLDNFLDNELQSSLSHFHSQARSIGGEQPGSRRLLNQDMSAAPAPAPAPAPKKINPRFKKLDLGPIETSAKEKANLKVSQAQLLSAKK
jgi:hypothetical protein